MQLCNKALNHVRIDLCKIWGFFSDVIDAGTLASRNFVGNDHEKISWGTLMPTCQPIQIKDLR